MSESNSGLTPYELAMQAVEDAKRVAEEVRKAEVAKVLEGLKATIAKYNITAEELGFTADSFKARGSQASALGRKQDRRSAVEPKYRGPNGEVWSGRGMAPAWMAPHLEKGGKIEDFLIKKEK